MEIYLNLERSKKGKIDYYIPWWDDYVDINYDFESDEPTDGIKVTAHHLYENPPYDGILVSKVKIEENKVRLKRIVVEGIHGYLDFRGPIFGDCGAFGYIHEKEPPFDPSDIADYYDSLGFNFGVSVDHLIVPAVEDEKEHRYAITLKNAERFLNRHKEKGYQFVPVGAAQGWDTHSYKSAVADLLDMGYEYIAVGGLTRSQTPEVLRVMRAVQEVVGSRRDIGIHLFGVARLNAIRDLQELGLTSFDSASYLRRAWLGANSNYITAEGRGYSALRVPQSDRSPKAKKIMEEKGISIEELQEYEEACLSLIRSYDQGDAEIEEVLEALLWYDNLMGDTRKHAAHYTKTLKDKPWQKCDCRICKQWGVEVIIFRGNNRNRRRGFHNTRMFYDQLQNILGTAAELEQQRLDQL